MEQTETHDQEQQFEHTEADPADSSQNIQDDGSIAQGIGVIGAEITESIRGLLQTMLHRKEEIASTREIQEQQIDSEVRSVEHETDPQESADVIKGYERRRYELYQTYLRDLGDLSETVLHDLMSHLHPLSEPNKLFALAIHELEDSIKEIDRSRRKFAVDLKKKLDEKRYTALESRYQQLLREREAEKVRMSEVQRELDDLTRNLGMNQTELRRRIAGEDEWKDAYSRDLRKVLIEEVRATLEKEIRSDMEKRIRAEMENEIRNQPPGSPTPGAPSNGARVRQVRKTALPKRTQNFPNQQGATGPAQQPYPFVKCPSCSERIEIRSSERPIDIQCPGCGSGYTINEKSPQDPGRALPDVTDVSEPATPAKEVLVQALSQSADSDSLPSATASNTKDITCPHCGKTHVVPQGLTTRLTCVCGRRIKTY